MKWMEEQLSLFDLDGLSLKMSQGCSQATPEKISAASSKSSAASKMKPLLYLDLRKASGQMRGISWETVGVSPGESEMPSIGESPRDGGASLWSWTIRDWTQTKSCLSNVLEGNPDVRYDLSAKACLGILNRAKKRGKELPKVLREALEVQAS